MTLDDGATVKVRHVKYLVIATSIRDALLFVLITHAVLTVLFSPRRNG